MLVFNCFVLRETVTVSVRERASWKSKSGEDRSQNAFAIYEVADGLIRRVWYYPSQN